MNNTILITGTSGPIGYALAQEFTQNDYQVIAVDKQSPPPTLSTQWTYTADITQNPGTLTQQIINDCGPIHAVIHNAAADDQHDFHKMNNYDLTYTWQTNFLAPAIISQTISQHMIEHNTAGVFLFISTLHTTKVRRHIGYSTSKAATLMLATEMADALAPHNIRVNTITPGAIHNPTNNTNTPPHPKPGSTGETIVPLGYLGHPNHITDAALFLCDNNKATYITGANITIDGGLQHYNWLHHTYGHNQPFR